MQTKDNMIGLKEVVRRVNLSRSAIRRRELEGEFPKRIYLSVNKITWAESEIDAWIEEQKQNRTNKDTGEN